MSDTHIISPDTGLPVGTVCPATRDDRPSLFDLYRTCSPGAMLGDIVAELKDHELGKWLVFKDATGEIRAAMFPCQGGVVHVLVDPADAESEEVARGFLRLAETVRGRLIAAGITDFFLAHYGNLHRFGEILERWGLVGPVLMSIRSMQFDADGEPTRRN